MFIYTITWYYAASAAYAAEFTGDFSSANEAQHFAKYAIDIVSEGLTFTISQPLQAV